MLNFFVICVAVVDMHLGGSHTLEISNTERLNLYILVLKTRWRYLQHICWTRVLRPTQVHSRMNKQSLFVYVYCHLQHHSCI